MVRDEKTTRRRRPIAAAAMVAGVLLSAAACGGDSTSSTEATTSRCTPSAGVTKDQINLGMLYSGTNLGSDASTLFRAGVDARLGDQNSKGGLDGRKITYSVQDDESSRDLNLVAARTLLADNSVLGIVQFSMAPSGSADFLAHQNVPAVDSVLPEPTLGVPPNVFGYARPLAQEPTSSGLGDFIAAQGGRRVVTVSVELSASVSGLGRIATESLQAAGVKVVGNLQVPLNGFDPAQFGAQLKATGADSIFALLPGGTFYQVVAGARAAGMDLKVALGNITTYDHRALAQVGAAAAGAYSFIDYAPFELDTTAHRRFLAAMATYAPQASAQPEGSSLIGWISTDLLLRGIEAAGTCPTRASLLTGLRSLTHYDADGLLPAPINLHNGVTNITPCYDYVQVNQAGTGFVPAVPLRRCGRVLPVAS